MDGIFAEAAALFLKRRNEMNQKTLKALKGSIKKWEKIVAGTGIDTGEDNCPLCQLFHDGFSCLGCSIHELTGRDRCMGTPQQKWVAHHFGVHSKYSNVKIECKICERHAKAEVKFLKSLLPIKKEITK